VIGREKVWSLPFADDLVILAKREREMKEIMKCLGKYVGRKTWKTKMMEWRKLVDLGRKENRKSKRVQILGLHIQQKSHQL
jgi:hypothetical protein